MTTLIERLRADSKEALKAKDAKKRTALVTLTSEAERPGLDDGKRDSTDDEVMGVIREFIKNGNKTLAALGESKPDLRATIEYELALLATYLPKQASDDEVRAEVTRFVAALPQPNMKMMGAVMANLNAVFDGNFDKTLASTLVKEALSVKVSA